MSETTASPARTEGRTSRGETVIEVDDLRTYIRLRRGEVKAVDGVSFRVARGETLGIVGESGCGKTMTGMSIMRLLPNGGYIAGGSIRFGGKDLATAEIAEMQRIRGNKIGMVFQDPMTSLNPTMTIGKQIAEGVKLHKGVSDFQAMGRAAEVLDLVGMPRPAERLRDYPHQLSGGLRQRVMIAMALACEPDLIIADEPTTALDVTIQAQILGLLERLKAELGMALILITHDMGVIAGRTDRTMVMYAGQVIETADTAQLFGRMRHPYTEALLASIPQLDQDKSQRLYSIPGLPPDLTHPPKGCRFAARCLYATSECRESDPKLGGDDPAHPFACFHPRSTSAEEVAGKADLIVEAVAAKVEGGTGETASVFSDVLATSRDDDSAGDGGRSPGVAAGSTAGTAALGSPPEGSPSGATSEAPILDFVNVSKEFNVTAGAVLQRKVGTLKAVTEVSLSIGRGETLGIVGESGCGKTTLGRMGVALEIPTSGNVVFDGTALGGPGGQMRETRTNLQMMFQDPYASLDPRMKVRTIVGEPMAIAGTSSDERLARTRQLIDEVGLPRNALDRRPHEFSGGQRQRIGLARALALSPKVIIADEPVSALDVSIRSQILNLMKRLQNEHDLSYMFISHDLSVVRYLADRIAVMYLGKVIEIGTGDDIYERAAHPYTRGLLDTIPVPKPDVERAKHGAAIRGELPSPLHPPSGCRFRTRCPRAQEICALETPELTAFGGLHQAACHFPLQTPVSLGATRSGSSAKVSTATVPPQGSLAKERKKLEDAVTPHLEQGERLEFVWPAKAAPEPEPSPAQLVAEATLPEASNRKGGLGPGMKGFNAIRFDREIRKRAELLMAKSFVAALTDRNVVVVPSSGTASNVARLPRDLTIGSRGKAGGEFQAGGQRYWVDAVHYDEAWNASTAVALSKNDTGGERDQQVLRKTNID